MKKSGDNQAGSAADLISQRIADLDDWRGETLARLRQLIREADPQVVEEWKWENPVWSHDGILCTGESYKAKVKLTFPKGASLKDPSKLFNSSLEGNARRAIDVGEGEQVDATAFKALIRAAIEANAPKAKGAKTATKPAAKKATKPAAKKVTKPAAKKATKAKATKTTRAKKA